MHNLIHYFFFKLYSTKSYLKELNFDLFNRSNERKIIFNANIIQFFII